MFRAACAALVLLAFVPSLAGQATQDPCPEAPTPELFAAWDSSLENLAFDGHGHLYLSDAGRDRLVRFTPDGKSEVALEGVGNGLVWGPDERLYVAKAEGDAWDILRSVDANATAFGTYATGLPAYNGMAFDAVGNLYVSDDNIAPPETPPDLVRVPAGGGSWEPWTDVYGPDGLALDPGLNALYTVVPADQSSPVLLLSTTDRSATQVVAYLSFGVATLAPGAHPPQGDPAYPEPKGLDDLTLGPDGLLYIAAHLSGELIRLDPDTAEACILASGLEEPSSVRVAHGFGAHGGKLFVTTFGGTGVTGLAANQAGMPQAGKVWMLDVGFVEEPVSGTVTAPETSTETGPVYSFDDNDFDAPPDKKDTPVGPLAFAALAAAALVLRRR